MRVWLELESGRRVEVEQTCTIGRSSGNTLALADPKVSRRHALVHVRDDRSCWLIDYGSSNGVSVNGQRVHEPVRLQDGDQLSIGAQEVRFRQPEEGLPRRKRAEIKATEEITERVNGQFTETGTGIVILGPSLDVTRITENAGQWLKNYTGTNQSNRRLPATVEKWLRAELRPAKWRLPLLLSGEDKRLVIRLVEWNAEQILLVVSEELRTDSPERLITLGLTQREAEVLHWIIQGKSNPEIGTILDLSPRTVGTHVEHILKKLGVENRAAAAFTAMEHLGQFKERVTPG